AVAAVWTLGVRWWTPLRELEAELGRVLGPLRREEALALALISGLAEEMLFRGAVQAAWGWVAASLLFALVHFGGRRFRLWSLWALLAGMLLGGLVIARGNLLPAIVAHTVINAAGLLRLARESAPARPGGDADGR